MRGVFKDMVEYCLACGRKKTDYKMIMAGVYFI